MKCNIDKQLLIITNSSDVYSDTIDYLTAEFTFSDDWSECDKVALFSHSGAVYKVPIENGMITADKHLNLSAGAWSVSIVGTSDSKRITTNTVLLNVHKSGYSEDTVPMPFIPIGNYKLTYVDNILRLLYGDQELASTPVAGPSIEEIQNFITTYIEEHKDEFKPDIDKEAIIAIIDEYLVDGEEVLY